MGSMMPNQAEEKPNVAIVDYGLGNLFSIRHACLHVGLQPVVTASGNEIAKADAVLLPGVGAFGDAMASLNALDLIAPIRESAESGKPLVGICLGMQLLMRESFEFGTHKGLGLIEGEVRRLNGENSTSRPLKVPHVGWNRVYRPGKGKDGAGTDPWDASPLREVADGEYMYFVHSYYVIPEDSSVVLSYTRYGDTEFCSSLSRDAVFASQFHPERSGPRGLDVYRNIRTILMERSKKGKSIV
jgi:imidazole glycerol-phosphate synthase subunit HisH